MKLGWQQWNALYLLGIVVISVLALWHKSHVSPTEQHLVIRGFLSYCLPAQATSTFSAMVPQAPPHPPPFPSNCYTLPMVSKVRQLHMHCLLKKIKQGSTIPQKVSYQRPIDTNERSPVKFPFRVMGLVWKSFLGSALAILSCRI